MTNHTPRDHRERRRYLAYLLRLWRAGGEAALWRASLESPRTGEQVNFASLDELLEFLRQQTGQKM